MWFMPLTYLNTMIMKLVSGSPKNYILKLEFGSQCKSPNVKLLRGRHYKSKKNNRRVSSKERKGQIIRDHIYTNTSKLTKKLN